MRITRLAMRVSGSACRCATERALASAESMCEHAAIRMSSAKARKTDATRGAAVRSREFIMRKKNVVSRTAHHVEEITPAKWTVVRACVRACASYAGESPSTFQKIRSTREIVRTW